MRHRILLQTNNPKLSTGLAENGRLFAKYLYRSGKYDIAYYCTQSEQNDPIHEKFPWKSYGCIPADPNVRQQLNSDPLRVRNAAYGAYRIDEVIKDFKPTIWWGSDDVWAFQKGDYMDKPWYKQIHPILHITVDSLPVIDLAYEQAKVTPNYYLWSKFALDEMHQKGPEYSHVKSIYGAMDTEDFQPIDEKGRRELRKMFNLDPETTIFLFVGRNQLRKQFVRVLEAFGSFKKDNPNANAKLHFHTSWSEKGAGWDIPRLATYYGIKKEDVLCTYVCKNCGKWSVRPYDGEDLNCPHCHAEKSMITANIVNGVPQFEMKYLYGLADACLSVFSSGGQEYHSVQSLLCGKYLACTNYSCGADFCEQKFVYPVKYHFYDEAGTCFLKSASDVGSIKMFLLKCWKMSRNELRDAGLAGTEWARKTFSIDTIGRQWTELFDSLPPVDWSSIHIDYKPKNVSFPFPTVEDEDKFLDELYSGILFLHEEPNGSGRKYWKERMKQGMSREDVWRSFLAVAQNENNQHGPKQDFGALLDNTGRKRALLVLPRSMGDVLIATSLLQSFHEQYKDTNLYFATQAENIDILEGNEYIFKILPYTEAMEHEMLMIGAGGEKGKGYFDYYFNPAIQCQQKLNYLNHDQIAYNLDQ